jgi:hypothetical protein
MFARKSPGAVRLQTNPRVPLSGVTFGDARPVRHSGDFFSVECCDEILSREKTKEQEKDVRFVESGEYLCEVRAKQYWRLEWLNSFDEFLEKRFVVDSRPEGLLPHDDSRNPSRKPERTTDISYADCQDSNGRVNSIK